MNSSDRRQLRHLECHACSPAAAAAACGAGHLYVLGPHSAARLTHTSTWPPCLYQRVLQGYYSCLKRVCPNHTTSSRRKDTILCDMPCVLCSTGRTKTTLHPHPHMRPSPYQVSSDVVSVTLCEWCMRTGELCLWSHNRPSTTDTQLISGINRSNHNLTLQLFTRVDCQPGPITDGVSPFWPPCHCHTVIRRGLVRPPSLPSTQTRNLDRCSPYTM